MQPDARDHLREVWPGPREEAEGKGRNKIVFTEIPYEREKAGIIEKIADEVKSERIEGIYDIRDESDRDGMRVVIELK